MIGGIVEIAPLFYLKNTIEKVQGMRPYTPLELVGRNVYVREGCYLCHSQMIRPFRDEVERYGHYSLAAESMYDHPFQWGSKRTGPDLARVGGRYSDAWHVGHMVNPQSVVPESIMPLFPQSHFSAIEAAFTVVLILEVISLIFTIPGSFSRSVGKQFELLGLAAALFAILLTIISRKLFAGRKFHTH